MHTSIPDKEDDQKRRRSTHRALVGFLSSVSSHVDDQHVLRLERLLLSTALSPLADERLLVCVDVVVRNVLQIRIFYQNEDEDL